MIPAPAQPANEAAIPPLAALLEQVAAGDREAFRLLYDATAVKLYGVVLRILTTTTRAEDAMQEIYYKIWNRSSQFDAAKGSAIAWLATIARNHALDDVRRYGHPLRDTLMLSEELVAANVDPLTATENSQMARRLSICMQMLDLQKQQMVTLAYQYGLSREELAERFGHPVATVKTWLRRSLESLKNCLSS